jgi:hypothetical protein
MLYLRTASGTFINAARIVELAPPGDPAEVWVAVCSDGQDIPLARYYSAPGRVERELPHLLPAGGPVALPSRQASRAAAVPAPADCSATACCAGS